MMIAVKEMKQSTSLAVIVLRWSTKVFLALHQNSTKHSIKQDVTETVQKIGNRRPTYETRRMAAAASRELDKAVNRKQIRRIFHRLAWIEPSKTKKPIIKVSRKLFSPTAPSQLWEAGMSYVDCKADGWCYCFNVVDAFTVCINLRA